MHIQTHLLSGWCLANCLPLAPRQRLLCMVAATAPDLDGLSLLFGGDAYRDWHHILAHNAPFALLLSAGLAAFSVRPALSFLLYLSLVHLHFVLDYFGSGPHWGIPYLWPFDPHQYLRDPNTAWPFFSWQNISVAFAFVAWTVWIALRYGRTPLESLMPELDRKLVAFLRSLRPPVPRPKKHAEEPAAHRMTH